MGKCQTVTVTNRNINYSCSSQFFNQLGSESSCLWRATAKACTTAPCINLKQTKYKCQQVQVVLLGPRIHKTSDNHLQNKCNCAFNKMCTLLSWLQRTFQVTYIQYTSNHSNDWPQSTSAGRLMQEIKLLQYISTFLVTLYKLTALESQWGQGAVSLHG